MTDEQLPPSDKELPLENELNQEQMFPVDDVPHSVKIDDVPADAESASDHQETGDLPPPPPEEPEVEVTADYTPHPNVSFDLDPIEPITGAKTTEIPIELVNLDLKDLSKIRRELYGKLGRAQKSRSAVVKSTDSHEFYPLPLNDQTIWATESEISLIQQLQYNTMQTRRAAGNNLFEDDLESQWSNLPKRGNEAIAISNLSGANSPNPMQRIRAKVGLSIEAPVPLWNSGMHVRISSQGAMDALQLQTKMNIEKIDDARETSGYTYSAPSVYLNRLVANFILEHVTSTTVGTVVPSELLKLIKITDLDALSIGAAAANHPKGYPMTRRCITSKGGCGHVVEGLIQPRRMLLVRHSRIDSNQWAHMNKKTQTVDVQSVRDYQKGLRPEVSRLVPVMDNIYLRLVVPSLYDFDRLAGAWMSSLSDRARQLVPSNANAAEREMFMFRATAISQLLSYLPWVDAVVEYDPATGEEPVVAVERVRTANDPEAEQKADSDIEFFLRDIAEDPERCAEIAKGIADFIDNMTLSVAAVEKSPCPSCQKPLFGDETSKHKHAVQINPIELFFTLLHLRIERASA